MPPAGRRTSQLLADLARGDPDDQITFGDLFHALEQKAFGALILVLSLPNCIPMLPGVSTVTGLGIILLALQLAWGREEPWLPAYVRDRGFSRAAFAKMIDKALPWIERIERVASPRLHIMTGALGRRIVGTAIALLGLVLILPIPIIGNIPPGIAITILALGLLERDGWVVAFGYAAGTAAVIVVGGLLAGIVVGVDALAS